jgi:hypothetical protein
MIESSEDFKFIKKHLFDECGFKITNFKEEDESIEYCACRFKIQDQFVLYRQAKITPTKLGQFVTIWKRPHPDSPIQPYDIKDNVDLFIVTVKFNDRFGQFVFPKSVLIQQRVLSVNGKGGKRALRVYPPWDKTESQQARKTQQWQLDYFIEISKSKTVDAKKLKGLYQGQTA